MSDEICRGCNRPLDPANCWMEDGCPCNSPRGVNDGNQLISQWRQARIQELQHELEQIKTRPQPTAAYVICQNDYPHAVYLDDAPAARELLRLQSAARRPAGQSGYRTQIYYHMHVVPFAAGDD
jgi:hypothetical protein